MINLDPFKKFVITTLAATVFSTAGCHSPEQIRAPGSSVSAIQSGCQVPESIRTANHVLPDEIELPNSATARTWMMPGAREGIVFVSGVDGGFIEPVDGIYDRIAERNMKQCVSSIFVSYRNPGELGSSLEDAQEAAAYLRDNGVTKMAIAGWSFGGAVIAHAATTIPEIVTVIGFSPQSIDTEAFEFMTDHQSLLLFHSTTDENVPFDSSEIIMDETPNYVHKILYPIDGADHHLTGMSAKIDPIVMKWVNHMLLGLPD